MKNQYFGDKRDLLKYSLLEAIAWKSPNVQQLTCIWLLTPPSRNNDGNRHFRQEASPTPLAVFLKQCVESGRRDVSELARYMTSCPGHYFSFGDEPSRYFTDSSRRSYFDSIPDRALHSAVVFFDPDNGLEPTGSFTPAHLRYAELERVFSRMDRVSVAVVYQHLPRQRAEEFWPRITTRLKEELGCPVGFVAAGDVGFFIALRDAVSIARIRQILIDFQGSWPTTLRVVSPQ